MTKKKYPKTLTVGQLIARLQKFPPKSPVRLDVPVGPNDFHPTLLWDAYVAEGGTICDRDNGDPLASYCGVLTHHGDVILRGGPRNIIQGPQPRWNAKTSEHYFSKKAENLIATLTARAGQGY